MSWAENKYAINSSLGTEDFAPLNELIIKQTDYEIHEGDKPLYYLMGTAGELIRQEEGSKSVKIGVNGKCRLSYICSASGSFRAEIKVFVGSNEVYSETVTSSGTYYTDLISVKKKDVIKITFVGSSGNVIIPSISQIKIEGQLVPSGVFGEVI